MGDDGNDPNPQRAEVLRRERRKIEHDVWLQMRIEAILADAATVAVIPGIELTMANFLTMAQDAYEAVQRRLRRVVDVEVANREQTLASPTNKKEDQS